MLLHPLLSCVMPTHQCWTPILSRVPPCCCASPLRTHSPSQLAPAGMHVPASQACCGGASSPPCPWGSREHERQAEDLPTSSLQGSGNPCCPLGILGSHALFVQLLRSNKSKKYVFVGFVVCLSLITFFCILAGLFNFSDWRWPPALQPRGLFYWCWAVFVNLWKWFSKNNI